ncbi:uncharacterized protein BJ212DRAFT_1364816 [Suillus subaureus]|uniref:Uncharacterized protein n=1 Tax=Suillus subaureus TaxID=48587 RepID=A0A9P7JCB6_9AGAM|nr:uncharacterized protein BJ212DRAFT_1364816 [Suillus subaureus]KAG1813968.1 hypothetical protein BJ212DRAFT_1364816 [Suillus subaureus]
MRLFFCTILYLVQVIRASQTINTSEDYEALSLSFTNRTLWNIISSCVLTLFACIYSTVHPNIPSPEDSPVSIIWRRLGMMIMVLFYPELIIAWAMGQWLSARQVTKKFKKSGHFGVEAPAEQYELEDRDGTRLLEPHAEVAASAVHSTPVSTSGYGLTRALAKPFKTLWKAYFSKQFEDYEWTQTHSFFVLMGGFMLYDVDGKPYSTIQPGQLLRLIDEGCIDAPIITANQIRDKSKGNVISKGTLMLQVGWFVMQLITRAVYHLDTTEFEIATLAFAVLNFLTYPMWWNKPLDVQCPYPVYWKSTTSVPSDYFNEYEEFEESFPMILQIILTFLLSPVEMLGAPDINGSPSSRMLRVRTFGGHIRLEGWYEYVPFVAAFLMATIFGGVHCIAWYFTFPTSTDRALWRISAIAITGTPIAGALFGYLMGPFIVFCVLSYVSGRVILLVLMFTTIRDFPPGAYLAVSWTSIVPHL